MTRPLKYTPPTGAGPHVLATIDPAGDGGGLALGSVEVTPDGVVATLSGACRVSGYANPRAAAVGVGLAIGHVPNARKRLAVVVERPKKRRDQRAKHRAVELLQDVLTSIKRRIKPAVWVGYYPEQWKASVPKEIHHRRAWVVLTDAEREVPALWALNPDGPHYQHDTADAIALWLWAVGRLGRGGGTLPAART